MATRRLGQFIHVAEAISAVFGTLYLSLGLVRASPRLLWMAGLLAAVGVSALALDFALRRTKVANVAFAVALVMLSFECAAVYLLPFLYPAFLIIDFVALLLPAPYVSRGRLAVLGGVTLVAMVLQAAMGNSLPPGNASLGRVGPWLLAASVAICAALALFLIWQFSTRLRAMADEAVNARDRAVAAQRRDREAFEWATFLSEATRILGESLDYRDTLGRVARLSVPAIADWCTVAALEGEGTLRRVAAFHADPAKEPLAKAYAEGFPSDRHRPELERVVTEAASILESDVTRERLERFAQTPEHLDLLLQLGVTSTIIVPMVARGRTLGALSFMISDGRRSYGPSDLARAQDLAQRAALAVDNARLFHELADARDRLQAAVAARDDFLSIASHELKTPLTPLKLQLDMARRQLPPTQQLDERLGAAQRQVSRLQGLVSRLLDVSQLASDRLRLEPQEVDLRKLLGGVVDRFREGGAEVPIALDAPEAVVGNWDPLRIDQVVTNLLGNAVKYGAGKPVALSLSRRGGIARIEVRDHGIGISPEQRGRLFERFERGVSARNYGGLGLGLWIVRKIVEASGGTVGVQSLPGEGALFTIELPGARPGHASDLPDAAVTEPAA